LLSQPDFEFHYCSEGAKALDTAIELQPLVILQDLVMPDGDGISLLKAYRKHPVLRNTPVVVLSVQEDPAVKKQAFEAGAHDYMVKLPDPIEFVARVRHHAEGCLADRQLAEAMRALRESQQQTIERNIELEKINEQKNRLLGMAAHDLRNPIGVVLNFSEFLMTETFDVLGPEHQRMVTHIKNVSEFMLKLVEDLLDVTTIEAGQLRLNIEAVDLGDLIRRNLSLNEIFAAKKNISLELVSCPDLPPLPIDAGKINQVLNNLVGNAVKYSFPDTLVQVSVERSASDVTVSVSDQGKGIPEKELHKLFKPFGRTNVTATAGERSTGLGLAIVRKIVEGHGGQIGVRSQLGTGSTFRFSLPVPS
jgi:signal transduction histidine kinase